VCFQLCPHKNKQSKNKQNMSDEQKNTQPRKLGLLDVREISAFALTGCVLFGIFKLINVYTREKIGDSLSIDTRMLHNDVPLLVMLKYIEQHTDDKIGFIRLVGKVDDIVELHANARNNRPKLQMDENIGFSAFTQIQKELSPRLYADFCAKNANIALQKDFADALDKICVRTNKHLQGLYLMTTGAIY
jgi:hypothetical protein